MPPYQPTVVALAALAVLAEWHAPDMQSGVDRTNIGPVPRLHQAHTEGEPVEHAIVVGEQREARPIGTLDSDHLFGAPIQAPAAPQALVFGMPLALMSGWMDGV